MATTQKLGLEIVAINKTAQAFASVQNSMGGLTRSMQAFKAFAIGAFGALSVGTLVSSLKQTIVQMDDLGKAAQKIGIPVDQLSKLEYAAKLSDVSLESLTGTVAKFSRSLSEISVGGKNDAGSALKAIGVSATDAEGKLRPTATIIEDVAEKFSTMRDGANKTALAIAMFGRSGAEMIPLLNGGRDAIAAAGRELEQFGGVVTPEAARQAEQLNDNFTRLETASNGLMREIARRLLPPLIQLTEKLLELVKTGPSVEQWMSWITPFFTELGNRIATTRKEIELITGALQKLGLIAKSPLEITIPGADLAPPMPKDKPLIDAPALPAIAKKDKLIPPGTLDDICGAGKAVSSLELAFKGATPEAGLFSDSLLAIGQSISSGLSNALTGLITGTMSAKEAFAQMAQSIIKSLADIAAQLAASQLLKMFLGGITGGGAGFNIGGMTFGGLYANGGMLGAGQWGIAGEAGPEIIHGPARITPMDRMGGQAAPMNVSINNYAGAEVRTRQGTDGSLQIDLVKAEIARDIARGGNVISQAVERGYGLRRAGR